MGRAIIAIGLAVTAANRGIQLDAGRGAFLTGAGGVRPIAAIALEVTELIGGAGVSAPAAAIDGLRIAGAFTVLLGVEVISSAVTAAVGEFYACAHCGIEGPLGHGGFAGTGFDGQGAAVLRGKDGGRCFGPQTTGGEQECGEREVADRHGGTLCILSAKQFELRDFRFGHKNLSRHQRVEVRVGRFSASGVS